MTGKVIQVQQQITESEVVFDLRNIAPGSYQLRMTDGTIHRIARIVKL
jgi:lysyl endopeptidase